jgi:hypothetical protein
MSREDVDVVRRWLWAFENDTDAFRETLHPEIEWRPYEDNHAPSYGVEGGMRIRNGWLDSWDEHRVGLDEVVEAGGSVVASVHVVARGRASGVEVDVCLYLQFKIRDRKVIYVFEPQDEHAAREAAGLSE